MSHTDDVINKSINWAFQIHKQMWIFKMGGYFEFWTFDLTFSS